MSLECSGAFSVMHHSVKRFQGPSNPGDETYQRGKSLDYQNAFNGIMVLVEGISALGGATSPMGPAYQHIMIPALEWSLSFVTTVKGPRDLCSLLR